MYLRLPTSNNLFKRLIIQPVFMVSIAMSLCTSLNAQTPTQKTILHQTQLWYAYFNNLKFSDKYRLLTDIQERQFIEPVGAQGNLIFRSILYRRLGNNWEAGAGMCVFFTSP